MALFAAKRPVLDSSGSIDDLIGQCRTKLADYGLLCGDQAVDRVVAAKAVGAWLADSGADAAIQATVVDEVVDDLLGYGPLEVLMSDRSVSEIMVNACDDVWIEQGGRLQRSAARFRDADQLNVVLERLLMGTGRRIDQSSPMVDAHLPDGSRLNAVLAPVAATTPLITIRKFPDQVFSVRDLIDRRSIGAKMAAFLHAALLGRANILISGGTGAGKTTLLGALIDVIPDNQRIVTIEDVREIRCCHPHTVSQQCHPGNAEGRSEIGMRELVRNALRMRPDRLIIGEVRGAEAADMVQAMNTGHGGSMTTLHANSAPDALHRLESMLAMAWAGIDSSVLRRWMTTAIDLVVHCERLGDGHRRVQSVAAVDCTDGSIQVLPLFTALGEQFRGCGVVPQRCLERMAYHGVRFPADMFAATS